MGEGRVREMTDLIVSAVAVVAAFALWLAAVSCC